MATEHTHQTPTESTAAIADEAEGDDPYEIRLYESADREGFLELYDLVLGDRDDEWFRWKYEDNPYTDHVPIVLATHDGDVVGTKPCFALELRAGDRTIRGFQPADVMVHPDHRRRGLYSRTTERMKSQYRDRDPSLFFNFPNQATLNGSLKHGWQVVEEVPTYYRVQRPDAIVGDGGRLSTIAKGARPLATAYARTREVVARSRVEITVERFETVPIETFVSLYERAVPPTLHANRDRTFYGWRYDNPKWEYQAYVAQRDSEPIAGVVAGTKVKDGSLVTCLTDVVPLVDAQYRREGLRAIITDLLADRRDSDLLAASGTAIPPSLLSTFGFHSDLSLPLSAVSLPTTQVTYPLVDDGGHEWTVAERAIADATNWTVTFAEQDTR